MLCWELILHFLLAWILACFLKLMIKDVKYFKHPLHHPAPQAATAPYPSKFAPLISTQSCGCNKKSTPWCPLMSWQRMGFCGNQLPITDAVKGNLKERNLSVRINSKTNKNISKWERKWLKKTHQSFIKSDKNSEYLQGGFCLGHWKLFHTFYSWKQNASTSREASRDTVTSRK